MQQSVLTKILQHFAERTGDGGDMAIPPKGIRWTVLSPYPKVQEALARAVKQKGTHLGVLMPMEDVIVKPGVRNPYDDSSLTSGSLRQLRFTITVFIRSIKLEVTDGAFLMLTDWLEELTRSYQEDDNDTLRISAVRYLGLEPDYLVVEAQASINYFTTSTTVSWPQLLGLIVETTDNDGDGNPDVWFTKNFV